MKCVVVAMLLLASPARADEPLDLFAEGRYAAAADAWERAWETAGDPDDGVNAVVAWRTAGRYARAVALLARVKAGAKQPEGRAAQIVAALDERLATLTATATIDGPVEHAIVKVDGEPAERAAGRIVLDVGEHEVAIDQPSCAPVVTQVVAYAGGSIAIPYRPRCDRTGRLLVRLDRAAAGAFTVDGAPHRAVDHEAAIALSPGLHELVVESRGRPVLRERVAIRSDEATPVRVRYPWRSQRVAGVLGVTGAMRGGSVASGLGLALTLGVWSTRFRAAIELGSVMSTVERIGAPGHPWFGAHAALHVRKRPLWMGKLGAHRLAIDLDPVALRYDEVREISYFGIRTFEESLFRSVSFAPITLSASGPYASFDIALWPISVVRSDRVDFEDGLAGAIDREWGVGTFVTILGGWQLF